MSNHLLGWFLLAAAALWTWAAVLYISRIGKPREPIKATYAAGDVLINAGAITVAVIAAGRLL